MKEYAVAQLVKGQRCKPKVTGCIPDRVILILQ
jgi:hypothetical protein